MNPSSVPRTLVVATRNPGKLKEIQALLSDLPVRCVSVTDCPGVEDVVEDGETLEANALKKARAVSQATGLPTLADDSGLEVFALDGRPGVYSARYAGENVTYADNNKKLLRELTGVLPEKRKASFRCIICFIDGDSVHSTEGSCPGSILLEMRGSGGFGYDPLFMPDGFDKTFAELSIEEKNVISHRAKALKQMKEFLTRYFN
jgi:XTP/dITP diphosphohydrolase